MRRPLPTTAFLLVAFAFANGQVVQVAPHSGGTDVWGRYFDARHKITFSGRVTGIEKVRPLNAKDTEVTLLVRNRSGSGTSVVDIGPSWYVDHQTAKVKVGDNVQVTGSKAMIEGHGVVIASQVLLRGQGGPVLALRRLNGRAFWVGTESAQNSAPPTGSNVVQGRITGFKSYTLNNVEYQSAVLQTDGGQTLIDLGPQWYYNMQDVSYQIGDGVQVVVGPNPITVGPNLNIQSSYSIYGGSNIYTVRNSNGSPFYYWGG